MNASLLTLLAAVASAAAASLAVGALMGTMPELRPRREDTAVSERQQWLVQSGVDLTPRQFLLGSGLLAVLAYIVVLTITATPTIAIVPALTAGGMPRVMLERLRQRRLREVAEAWPDGVRDLVAAVAAGQSLNQAVEGLAANGPVALREAFVRYPTLSRMLGVAGALETIREELADPTSDRVLEVLILAHERGGQLLAPILRDLAEATTSDLRVAEQLQTDQLEQKINARAVFVMPWFVLVALTLREGPFRDFYASGAGVIVVILGGGMSLFGMWLINRLGRSHVEPRVLGGGARATERRGEVRA